MYAQLAAVSLHQLQRKISEDGYLTQVFKTLVEASAYLEKLDWLQPRLPQVKACALEIVT